MKYLIGSITDIDIKCITLQTESKKGYSFIVPDEKKYLFNKKYKVFVYKEMKLEKNNKFEEKYYAFLSKNEYFIFLFLLKITGIGTAIAINILQNNLSTLISAIIEENILALSTMPSLSIRIANSIMQESRKKKNKKELLLLYQEISDSPILETKTDNKMHDINENLKALGYKEEQIYSSEEKIILAIKGLEDKDEILREAIKIMYENKG